MSRVSQINDCVSLCLCREPSDNKASGGDNSQGHGRLASGATPGPVGAGPGGGGAGPGPSGVAGVPGMPAHSMSGSGHLQAPTSTTPEGSGVGLPSSFLSMEPHPSHLGVSEVHIKQEIPAGEHGRSLEGSYDLDPEHTVCLGDHGKGIYHTGLLLVFNSLSTNTVTSRQVPC